MTNLELTIIFFFALATTIYFFGKLLTWAVWMINPSNFSKDITKKQIAAYNLVMIFSLVLWSILFYNLI